MKQMKESNKTLPETGFCRISTVLKYIEIGKTNFLAQVKAKRFPQPIRITPGCVAWRCEDIHQLISELSKNNSATTNDLSNK